MSWIRLGGQPTSVVSSPQSAYGPTLKFVIDLGLDLRSVQDAHKQQLLASHVFKARAHIWLPCDVFQAALFGQRQETCVPGP